MIKNSDDASENKVFEALVIIQPTQSGDRRLVAAFRTMRRRVAAQKITHRV